MSQEITLSPSELSLMSDADIILQKRQVQEKMYLLLKQTQKRLLSLVPDSLSPEFKSQINPPKISRGENYKGLPYLILDYPSVFNQDNILAFRTMFYWGNFFSITLHLQGSYLTLNRELLQANLSRLIALDLFISSGESPWHYHYEKDNYVLLHQAHKEKILKDSFLKLSKKIPVAAYAKVPDKTALFMQSILEFLATE